MRQDYFPQYMAKADYTTNAASFADFLAKHNELMKYLSGRVWEYDKELGKRFAEWDKNLEEFDAEVLKLLQKWMDDGTMDHIINEVLMKQKLDKVVFESYVSVVNITNPLDITADVQKAVDRLPARGGTVFIPAGDWIMNGHVELASHTHIQGARGTIIRKTPTSESSYSFIAGKTNSFTGYGGGAVDIKIESIAFHGGILDSNRYRGNGFAFHHVQKLHIVDCDFVDAVFGGHAIDLAGCNDVLIENSRFIGQAIISGREYAEAIQIDSSAPASIGADWQGLDGLPTKDVVVRNCEFLPKYSATGVLESYAPNPIGNHGYTGGKPYENIKFLDNLVVNGMPTNSSSWRGWIHFYGVKNIEISGNTFKNTMSIPVSVIQFINSSGGRYDPSSLIAGTGTPLSNTGMNVSNNTFIGFDNPEELTLIRSYGTTYDGVIYRGRGYDISHNRFIDCGSVAMTEGQGVTMIQIYRAEEVTAHNNEANRGKTLVSVWDSLDVTVTENKGKYMAGSTIFVSDVKDAVIIGNRTRRGRRPLEIQEVTNVTCSGNVASDVIQTGDTNYANKFRNLINANIYGNTAATTDERISYGYYVYQTDENPCRNVNNHDNLADGFSVRPSNATGTMTNYSERGGLNEANTVQVL